ncbi:DoxX family protein [Rhodovulum strictum]|uniref:DoxX family membrane protein n=1 Tax=Rhodovulum strictum TaxID=58314 RepID=A0A844BCK3_9RHOB|nr:DoxX family protein [Rhodovulum strictum]MRH20338.1 DoxX family membrane protein [Rhodovulum strictum]
MTGKPPLVQVASHRALAAARMLVAAYFIAHATGIIVMPDGTDLVPRAETASVVSWAAITVVWLTGIALFLGRIVRPAALILAIYTVCVALISHAGLFAMPGPNHALWVELALVGALVMIALTVHYKPGSPTQDSDDRAAAAEDELFRTRLELAETRAALAEIQASDKRISYAPPLMRRSA